MTVLEVIQKSADFLGKKGVDSPRLQAELLLAHVLKLPRMKLYLNFERALTSVEEDTLREFVKRRGLREPLQHILGSTSFCGYEIAVNRHVLVPRPETELLAELGWEFLNGLVGETSNSVTQTSSVGPATSSPRPSPPGGERGAAKATSNLEPRTLNLESGKALTPALSRPTGEGEARDVARRSMSTETAAGKSEVGREVSALDFGTGSGCIAIAVAAKCPGARVTAVDVLAEALELAKGNAVGNGVGERITFLHGDKFTAIRDSRSDAPRSDATFDLIVSNPPYIPVGEIESLQVEVRDFDPRGALDGGADGLDFYRLLAAEGAAFLKPGGKMMVEFGDGQAEAISKIFREQKWIVESVKEDYSRRPRILIARRA